MSNHEYVPSGPGVGEVVEIVDPVTGERARGVVERVSDAHYVLRLAAGVAISAEVRVRWYDGETAWQAISRLERIDKTSASIELTPQRMWQPVSQRAVVRAASWESAPVRQSQRASVDHPPLLIEIITSTTLAAESRVHAACLDVSETGCRVQWPGHTPLVGDTVNLARDTGDAHAEDGPAWVPARVARTASLPHGALEVGFTFDATNADQHARVRAWHQAWVREYSQHRAA